SLTQLIKAQNQIRKLSIYYTNQALSDNFKKAILSHSQSIIYYESDEAYDIDYILLPTLYNLKTLSLTSSFISLKNISLPHIESVKIHIYNQLFLSEMSEFININGKTLKYLDLDANINDNELLGKLFQSIAQCCKNLVDLSILYSSE